MNANALLQHLLKRNEVSIKIRSLLLTLSISKYLCRYSKINSMVINENQSKITYHFQMREDISAKDTPVSESLVIICFECTEEAGTT